MSKISVNIKKYRKRQNLSQTDFANKLYVTKQAVSKWETDRGNPDVSLLPVIAKELGISIDALMGETTDKKKIVRRFSVIIGVLILVTLLSPTIANKYRQEKEFYDFKENIEQRVGIDLPDNGSSVLTGYNDWISQGNGLQISEMSYMVFDETNQTTHFEGSLIDDSKWVTELNDDLLAFVPSYLHNYKDNGNFFIVYNEDLKSYNEIFVEDGNYQYTLIVYQVDLNRFLVFDYSLNVGE